MSQKSRFRMQMQGITKFRNTFPQLPWSIVKEPKFIQTEHGYVNVLHFPGSGLTYLEHSNRLLTNGWWAYARKIVSKV
jgi:delta24(24(1))-sterol reductase